MEPSTPAEKDLVKAMLRLFAEQPPHDFLPSRERVRNQAGFSNTKMEQSAPSRHHLLQLFASQFSLDTPSWDRGMDKIADQVEANVDALPDLGPVGLANSLSAVVARNVDVSISDLDGFRRQLLFTLCATAGSPDGSGEGSLDGTDELDRQQFANVLADGYGHIMELYETLYPSTLASWGRETRPPLTWQHLAIALSALVEGLTLRVAADPGVDATMAKEVAQSASLILLTLATRAIGDTTDLAQATRMLISPAENAES